MKIGKHMNKTNILHIMKNGSLLRTDTISQNIDKDLISALYEYKSKFYLIQYVATKFGKFKNIGMSEVLLKTNYIASSFESVSYLLSMDLKLPLSVIYKVGMDQRFVSELVNFIGDVDQKRFEGNTDKSRDYLKELIPELSVYFDKFNHNEIIHFYLYLLRKRD